MERNGIHCDQKLKEFTCDTIFRDGTSEGIKLSVLIAEMAHMKALLKQENDIIQRLCIIEERQKNDADNLYARAARIDRLMIEIEKKQNFSITTTSFPMAFTPTPTGPQSYTCRCEHYKYELEQLEKNFKANMEAKNREIEDLKKGMQNMQSSKDKEIDKLKLQLNGEGEIQT